jgi:hypothetical protein
MANDPKQPAPTGDSKAPAEQSLLRTYMDLTGTSEAAARAVLMYLPTADPATDPEAGEEPGGADPKKP